MNLTPVTTPKLAQFPYNLIEDDAKRVIENESLIDFCKRKGIKTFANRPLNTTYNGKVLRLADYSNEFTHIDFKKNSLKNLEKHLNHKILLLSNFLSKTERT